MDRILVFLKSPPSATELACALARDGLDVFIVESPNATLAELASRHVDLVLLELDRHTLDLARAIRSAYPETRVVLTATTPLTQRQLERLDCGAVAFFPKPFDLRRAAMFMREHLTSRAWMRRLWHAEQPSSYAP